jgi:hypothetical protein
MSESMPTSNFLRWASCAPLVLEAMVKILRSTRHHVEWALLLFMLENG